MKKVNYGIDAPNVIRNLMIFGALVICLRLFFPIIKIGNIYINSIVLLIYGIICIAMGLWMLLYSMYGKFKHRERILNLINWEGNEQVLDIGTGRGLLVLGAAKRLTSGKAIGIDIWSAKDLSNNNIENTLNNATLEGVSNKVEIKDENVISMSFADNTFDIIISNLCLHNISKRADRKKACNEISRVLKNGGTGLISDLMHIQEYKSNFEEMGLQTKVLPASYLFTFPPLSILEIKKTE